MKNRIYKIADYLIYIGVALILTCTFILGDEDGDGKIDNKELMIIGGSLIFVGGIITIYKNLTE